MPKLAVSGPDPHTWNPTDSDPACVQATFTVTNSGDGAASGVVLVVYLLWVRYDGIYPTWPDLAKVEGVGFPAQRIEPGQSVARQLRVCGPTPPGGFYATANQAQLYAYFGAS